MPYKCISVSEAKEMMKAEAVTLLDIRDENSFQAGHIEHSIHLSNQNVEEIANGLDKENPVIIYCYHGNNSKGAADYFDNLGFTNAYSVDGGYEIWKLTA